MLTRARRRPKASSNSLIHSLIFALASRLHLCFFSFDPCCPFRMLCISSRFAFIHALSLLRTSLSYQTPPPFFFFFFISHLPHDHFPHFRWVPHRAGSRYISLLGSIFMSTPAPPHHASSSLPQALKSGLLPHVQFPPCALSVAPAPPSVVPVSPQTPPVVPSTSHPLSRLFPPRFRSARTSLSSSPIFQPAHQTALLP